MNKKIKNRLILVFTIIIMIFISGCGNGHNYYNINNIIYNTTSHDLKYDINITNLPYDLKVVGDVKIKYQNSIKNKSFIKLPKNNIPIKFNDTISNYNLGDNIVINYHFRYIIRILGHDFILKERNEDISITYQ